MAAKTGNLGALVDRAAEALGVTLAPPARAAIGVWLDLLREWNARVDLTAARTDDELVDLMLADAIVLAQHVESDARVVDVGTGAGAPGLALALVRPDLRVTLVEPMGKRAAFLRTVLGSTSRADVAIERARGEALAGRRAWDLSLARATLTPPDWLALGARLSAPGGLVGVLLAKEPPPERPGAHVQNDFAYTWPLTGAARRLVLYRLDS